MNSLSRQLILLFILTFGIARLALADGTSPLGEGYVLPDLYQLQPMNWQHSDTQNSDNTFQDNISNYHRTMVQGAVMDYLESKLSSLGVPRTAMTLTGAALIFAIGQDAKLDLNESKTMSLQFKDLKDADRAILYRLKYSW